MINDREDQDKKESRKILIALIALFLLLGVAIVLLLPMLTEIIAVHLEPGLGLKDSAVVAFFVTVVFMIVMAIAGGDGLLGEVQFMIGGFLGFFLIFWLMIAWIF